MQSRRATAMFVYATATPPQPSQRCHARRHLFTLRYYHGIAASHTPPPPNSLHACRIMVSLHATATHTRLKQTDGIMPRHATPHCFRHCCFDADMPTTIYAPPRAIAPPSATLPPSPVATSRTSRSSPAAHDAPSFITEPQRTPRARYAMRYARCHEALRAAAKRCAYAFALATRCC